MRIIAFVVLAALSSLNSPAFACRELVRFPQHLWGSTIGWWETYRVVEIVEARDEEFAMYLFDATGKLLEARIDNFAPRRSW